MEKVSREIEGLSDCKSMISDHIETIKRQGEDLVLNEFPYRILKLEALLKSEIFNISNAVSVNNKLQMLIQAPTLSDGGIVETPKSSAGFTTESVSKKRKKNNDIDPVTSKNFGEPVVPCNNQVLKVVELMKPEIHQLLEDIHLLKSWLQFVYFRLGDANDVIKSTVDEIFGEIESTDSETRKFASRISAYFASRGKLMSKVKKYPFVGDYQRCVQELDEHFHLQNQQALRGFKNNYATIYDLISKDLEKIKNPKIFNPAIMY